MGSFSNHTKSFVLCPDFHEGTQTLTALHVWEMGAQNSLLGENQDRRALSTLVWSSLAFPLSRQTRNLLHF